MCFFHSPSLHAMTRADALRGLAALSALPVMPTMAAAPNAQNLNAGRDLTALIGATALTGSDLTPLPDSVILLRGAKIEAVGRRGNVAIPESAFRVQPLRPLRDAGVDR